MQLQQASGGPVSEAGSGGRLIPGGGHATLAVSGGEEAAAAAGAEGGAIVPGGGAALAVEAEKCLASARLALGGGRAFTTRELVRWCR